MDQNNEPSKIVFKGEEFQRSQKSFQSPTPKITQLIIKYSHGAIKDERRANYVLVGFVALAIVISLFLIFGGSRIIIDSSKSIKILPAEL